MTTLNERTTGIHVGIDVGKAFLDIHIHERELHWQRACWLKLTSWVQGKLKKAVAVVDEWKRTVACYAAPGLALDSRARVASSQFAPSKTDIGNASALTEGTHRRFTTQSFGFRRG